MFARRWEQARHVLGLPFVTVGRCTGQMRIALVNQARYQEVGRFERDGDAPLRGRHGFGIPNGLGRDPQS